MSGVTHTAATATVTVPTTGIYQIDYNVNLTAGALSAIAIAVNGTVDASTNISILQSTGETGGAVIISLSAGDIITLRNNSATPFILDLAPAVGAQLDIFQLTT